VKKISRDKWRVRVTVGFRDNGSPKQIGRTIHGSKTDVLAVLDKLRSGTVRGAITMTTTDATVVATASRKAME